MAEDSKEKQQQKQKKAASSKTIDSWKKKKWYTLLAPEAFNHFELGETPANMPDEVEGRTVISNLMVLTGNSKRQNTNVIFRVTKVQGDKAFTEFINYQMAPSSIKRMMRRNKSRVDDSFVCKTSDSTLVRMKPFLVTASIARRAATTSIRRGAKQHVVREVAKVTYDGLCQDLVSGKFQKTIREHLHHIFPIIASEIRMMELITGEYKGRVEEPTPEPKAKKEEELTDVQQTEADVAATEAGETDAEEAVHEAEEAIKEDIEEEGESVQ